MANYNSGNAIEKSECVWGSAPTEFMLSGYKIFPVVVECCENAIR